MIFIQILTCLYPATQMSFILLLTCSLSCYSHDLYPATHMSLSCYSNVFILLLIYVATNIFPSLLQHSDLCWSPDSY
jgi:hypothetical protein